MIEKRVTVALKHTAGHIRCLACEQARQILMHPLSAEMVFSDAAANFLESLTAPVPHAKARYRANNTIKDYGRKIKALSKFFGQLTLKEIHLGHFREYQKLRLNNEDSVWAHEAGSRKVNAELGVLERFMRLAGTWTPELERYYERLIEDESEIPRALEPDEQEHYLDVAESRPVWHVLFWYSLLAVHTGFSSDEMRAIRQGDLNMNYQILAVNRRIGKNKFRRREVPLTDSRALWAVERLLERSVELVGKAPQNPLFPFRISPGHYTAEAHVSENGLRRKHEEVRAIAHLEWFQINGWRHTAITRMAEAGIPIATIMARAGHCSPKMTAHYTHIGMQAERLAMQSMNKKPVISIEASRLRRQLAGY